MKIGTYIKRSDLLKMQMFFLPRLKVNYIWYSFIIICAAVGAFGMIDKRGVLIWIVSSFIVGFLFALLFTFIGALLQMLMASVQKGIIGPQKIELSDTHFIEETEGSETRTKWSGIQNVYKNSKFIYVLINGCRVHVIPKRAFEYKEDFEKFGNEIMSKFKNA